MAMHNRKFLSSAVALVLGRLRNEKIAVTANNDIERIIINSNFLDGAPFEWIGIIQRYGIKNDLKVEFQRIDKKYGELPIAFELDMDILKWADQNNLDLLYDIFMISGLEATIQVGQKYHLPIEPFLKERAKYGNIPNTIEECEAYQKPV